MIYINRILRNSFPINYYYHFSLVNLTAATESATSYEHAHCAWYTKSLMGMQVIVARCKKEEREGSWVGVGRKVRGKNTHYLTAIAAEPQ